MDILLEQAALLVLSLFANGLSAMAGGGAGLLQLPVLLFLGLSFSTALATHKIASVALGIGATIRHWREGKLDYRFCGYILLCGLPGVVLGADIILKIPEGWTIFSLGILTSGLGLYSVVKKSLGMASETLNRDKKGLIIGGLVLFIIGALNGSLTSGTGLFVTLWLVRWFGLDYKTAVTYVLILVGLFWNSTGAFTIALQQEPRWDWLPVLLVGATLGSYLGAHIAITKGNKLVKRAFESLTILVGIKLIYDGWIILMTVG
ncbi:sulfite exporter TauE/SafE family protein [Neptuniibacter sp.]|uniref:sulfite exporter TauE/SafE family protein n=1 Tax=Neptuniibacter sp. TaxID=1962643 RepID=UPI003B5C4938